MGSEPKTGVIFDMDGVLVDSAEPHFKSWQVLAEENGREVTREQFSVTFGRQNNDIIPLLFGQVSASELTTLADRKEAIYRDLVRHHVPVLDGAMDLVKSLHRDGFGLAVGSSGPRANIELVLEAMGIQDCISVVVSGDEVTRGKPDPQVFTKACEGLALSPKSCVVIEDAPVGIHAAKAAGTLAVAVLTYHPAASFSQADAIVDGLSELTTEKIRRLFQ